MTTDRENAAVPSPQAPPPASAPSKPDSRTEIARKWADAGAKLIGAFAIAYVSWSVGDLENRVTSVDLLAKREEAETRLRASMFSALIDPVLGPQAKDGEDPDTDRQRLLAELLTLNFHDHLEFKPLLVHVDKLLANDPEIEDREESRRSLRSVARRVIDRQINALAVSAHSMGLEPIEPIDIHFRIDRNNSGDKSDQQEKSKDCQEGTTDNPARLNEPVCYRTKDYKYMLRISLFDFDPKKFTFRVYVQIRKLGRKEPLEDADFTLTHFDFPLTDNAQIDPRHRYSIVLYDIRRPENHSDKLPEELPKEQRENLQEQLQEFNVYEAQLKLVWFPEGYVTPQERPVDYLSLRETLGLNK